MDESQQSTLTMSIALPIAEAWKPCANVEGALDCMKRSTSSTRTKVWSTARARTCARTQANSARLELEIKTFGFQTRWPALSLNGHLTSWNGGIMFAYSSSISAPSTSTLKLLHVNFSCNSHQFVLSSRSHLSERDTTDASQSPHGSP